MSSRLVIGLMSGTSLDGIDAALVKITEGTPLQVELVEYLSSSYTQTQREQILTCCDEKTGTVDRICRLNFALSEWLADSVIQLAKKARIKLTAIDLIGSHGQTIYHDVQKKSALSTLQIGTGAVLAERTGITTVNNFRVRDVAAGGEGAPLVPYVDYLLYTHPELNRVLQNIGGIGNYTYLPAGAELSQVLGSDTGPGNMLIDGMVSLLSGGRLHYDKDGKWASQGQVSNELLNRLMIHPFIQQQAPKSTGREEFGMNYARQVLAWGEELNTSPEDLVATVTAFTAYSIIDAYRRFLPDQIDQVLIGGGGSYNPTLLKMIRYYGQRLIGAGLEVLTQEDLGYSSDAKEAIAFAVLAYQTMRGKVNNVPRVTGAEHPVILGEITPGPNFYQYLQW